MHDDLKSKKANWFNLLAAEQNASDQALVMATKPPRCGGSGHSAAQCPRRNGSPASASQRGREGARAKAEMLQPVKEFAYKLAQEETYPNRYAAAYELAERTREFAATKDVHLSKYRAQRTIAGWLKDSCIVFVINL